MHSVQLHLQELALAQVELLHNALANRILQVRQKALSNVALSRFVVVTLLPEIFDALEELLL